MMLRVLATKMLLGVLDYNLDYSQIVGVGAPVIDAVGKSNAWCIPVDLSISKQGECLLWRYG